MRQAGKCLAIADQAYLPNIKGDKDETVRANVLAKPLTIHAAFGKEKIEHTHRMSVAKFRFSVFGHPVTQNRKSTSYILTIFFNS